MGVQTKETDIGEAHVFCQVHKARPGAKLAAKLMRLVAPMLGMVKSMKLDDVQKMEIGDLAPLFARVLTSVSDDELDGLLVDLLSRTVVVKPGESGQRQKFDLSAASQIDDAFTGELGLMLKVAFYAVEVNFGHFFAGSGLGKSAEAAAPAKAEAP